MLENLCTPAIIYLIFSLTQIIIDIFKHMYNTAFIKFIVMIMFMILLNILCQTGMNIIAWIIVFVPFIMLTVITSLVLFVFGLSPNKGKLDYKVSYPGNQPNIPGRGRGREHEQARHRHQEKKHHRSNNHHSTHHYEHDHNHLRGYNNN